MTEKLLQTIWAFQYFNRAELFTTGGEKLEILFQGTLNTNQGPDFLNARIQIGQTVFAGSVELHLKASQWNQHGHSKDANYNNVILHVVLEEDETITPQLPTLELKNRLSKLLIDQYAGLLQQAAFIPCNKHIAGIHPLSMQAWQERLVAERLTRKAKGILALFERTGHHWEETFWQLLARNFGTKVNGDAFETLAQNIPYKIVVKHRNSLLQLEALLLGGAQLLPETPADAYSRLLVREYYFLQQKYNLPPNPFPVHFFRMRPQNFPTVRLAQLSALVNGTEHLFSKVLEAQHVQEVTKWLHVKASDYWTTHYRPGELAANTPKKVGADMVRNVIINSLVPLLFAYGMYHRNEEYKDKAVDWLQQTAAETNNITKGFVNISVANNTAFESQALLELKNEYCNYRRCLDCAVGNALLKQWNKRD